MAVHSLFEEPRAQSPNVNLRPYQIEALAAIMGARDRGAFRGLVVKATGTGKTTTFSEFIRRERARNPHFKCMVVAHQHELLEQAKERIKLLNPGVRISIEGGPYEAIYGSEVVVASVQSIGRRGTKKLNWFKPDVIIVDEAHHACADSYVAVFENFGVFDGKADLLGFTATPHRMDNKPLHGNVEAIFEKILYSYDIRQAIQDGWLCTVRGYRAAAGGLDLSGVKKTAGDYNQGQLQELMDQDAVTEFAIRKWLEVARDRRTVVFATGVDHARNVAKAFQHHGIKAEAVSGDMHRDERAAAIKRFRSGETQVLANMQLLTEGVDVPEIGCILGLRPTQSWALYTQMIGRGLRICEGKTDCIVIDIVGNTERHQLGKSPPVSVAGIFGLPLGLDMAGATVEEAEELFGELTEEQQAAVSTRVIDMAGLSAALTEVDLLSELAIPTELAKVTTWCWLKLSDEHYMLGCGSSGAQQNCRADMMQDALGRWRLVLSSEGEFGSRQEFELGEGLKDAFTVAERHAQRTWPNVGAVASANARWRRDPVTDGQRKFLLKVGFKPDQLAKLTKGTASQLISKHISRKKKVSRGR